MDPQKEIELKELEIKKLEYELKKLELKNNKSVLKSIFNPVFSSILVTVLGGVYSLWNFNKQHKNELELSKLQYEQKLYADAMNTGDSITACKLIRFYIAIGQLQPNDKINLCASPGYTPKDSSSFNKQVTDSVPKVDLPIINKKSTGSINKENALLYERQGFTMLANDDVAGAMEAFKKADEEYPSFHDCYDIYILLKKNPDKPASELRKIIKAEYPWGAPKEIIKDY